MPPPVAAALTARDLCAGALTDVSLDIPPGHILALSGPSGSGKSRLLRALANLDPHAGRVSLGDMAQDRVRGHIWRRAVMMVPADSQWWADTVGAHFPDGATDDLEALGFGPETLDWQVGRLSSGEKQRLALLRTVAHRPRALLLDEPTANLDPDTTARVEAWLTERIKHHGWPVIWVAHDPAQIERVADAHLRIAGGGLAEAPCS
ncbi:ABC transporter ATP-binding protein [Denitromonas sp.]|uniref:ABC transporter ATP-binding protein n=1 Tax=Denitromonas sp. TaxID=2734609 RepID=UPI003A896AD2